MTGATGFIGSHLLDRLAHDGHTVRALTRSPRLPRDGVAWITGDLATGHGVDELMRGAAALVHCAGAVRGARAEDFDALNVDGSRRVADAAWRAGVERMLMLSSLAAREPQLSLYASSKRKGEDTWNGSRVPRTIFRPPAVYGPGDKELVPLFGLMLNGVAVVPGHAGRTSLLYVTDLVHAIAAWLAAPAVAEDCFELDDGTPGGYDWTEMIRIATEIRGARIRRVDVPRTVLAGVGAANLQVARALRRAPMLTPGKVRELFHPDWVCSSDAIRRALRWTPEVRFAEGLRLTFADRLRGP